MSRIEAILSPAELPALTQRDLRGATCVVFDVLRATSTFVTALYNGAKAVIPVGEISEALAIQQRQPDVLLGGERDGVMIRGPLTGGADFDLGNSPREYTPDKVRGRTIVSTTTNGTRALRACAGAKTVLAASFLNLTATAAYLQRLSPSQIVLVCAGTRENTALEDVLSAGALIEILAGSSRGDDRMAQRAVPAQLSDSAHIAHRTYKQAKDDLAAIVRTSENARRLLSIPDLRDDVAFCLHQDRFSLVAKRADDGTGLVPAL